MHICGTRGRWVKTKLRHPITCSSPLHWRHNGRGCVSNHQPYDCLLNCLFRRRSKKTSKLRVTGICEGNSPVNSPHKWPVTRKMFPFDDVIMHCRVFRSFFNCRIKTGSGGVCCHNARGRVRNRKSNPDGVAGGIWRTVRTSPSALWQQTPTDRS